MVEYEEYPEFKAVCWLQLVDSVHLMPLDQVLRYDRDDPEPARKASETRRFAIK